MKGLSSVGTASPMADLLTLQNAIHQNAKDHGFWDDADNANIPTKLMLIVSEMSEALEEFRQGQMDLYFVPSREEVEDTDAAVFVRDADGAPQITHFGPASEFITPKPEGFGVELADALIRILDLAAFLGLDMGALVELKMEYNAGRPHKHGGRRV